MSTISTMPLTRCAEFLLVRLLAPVKRPRQPRHLRDEMSRVLRELFDSDRWESLLKDLVAADLVALKPLRLTDSGRTQALELLGLQHLPPRATWRVLRDRYLVPRVLGVAEKAGIRGRRRKPRDELGTRLLKERYDLPIGSTATLNAALEALACQALGFPEETKLTAVRDRILSRLLGIPERLDREQLAAQLIQAAAGAQRPDLASLREAVLRNWLTATPVSDKNGPVVPEPREQEPFDLPVFAATVQSAARTCPTGRFGDNKVLIHHVWKHLQGDVQLPVRSFEEFKQHLVEANHAGLLHLSRADLVQAMDPGELQQSETHYLGAVFHFILIEGGRP